jgi:hypothetical protein
MNTTVGFINRSTRLRTNARVESPLRRAALMEVRFEKPPTKKNSGITWRIHVRIHIPGIASRALSPETLPPS